MSYVVTEIWKGIQANLLPLQVWSIVSEKIAALRSETLWGWAWCFIFSGDVELMSYLLFIQHTDSPYLFWKIVDMSPEPLLTGFSLLCTNTSHPQMVNCFRGKWSDEDSWGKAPATSQALTAPAHMDIQLPRVQEDDKGCHSWPQNTSPTDLRPNYYTTE